MLLYMVLTANGTQMVAGAMKISPALIAPRFRQRKSVLILCSAGGILNLQNAMNLTLLEKDLVGQLGTLDAGYLTLTRHHATLRQTRAVHMIQPHLNA